MDHLGQNFGEYHLLRWLGGGGYGKVYLGEHIHNQTLAAVKVLDAHLTDPVELKAFINEARAIRLKHPNIVPLLDFGIGTNDIPFLVMEYAPYGTLRTFHLAGSQLPLSTIMTYVYPIASALQYAHNARLVHRDVKPENMLIGLDSRILLSDFGIATLALNPSSAQVQEMISGTLPYMAPEQFEGKAYPESDQYALAIVIYEWLSGMLPFQGPTTEIARQHHQANPQSLCNIVPGLSHKVEQVIMTALAKDPRQRFASVETFASALGSVSETSLIPVLTSANISTKVLTIDQIANSTIPTEKVREPQLADAATIEPKKSATQTQIFPSIAPKPEPKTIKKYAIFSKKRTIIAGLAAILSVIALLLIHSFTSGVQSKVTHPAPISINKTTPSPTAVPSIGKIAPATQPTVLPTMQPTLLAATQPAAVLTATPNPPKIASIRIDSGGSGAGLFVGDEDFSNTTPDRPSSASDATSSIIDTSGVSNPAPQSVYQSARFGDCLYTIPHLTANASYTVRLHFAESYWTLPGKRVFNVALNGKAVLHNFDIFAAAGAANKAVVEQFVVHADSTGTITIQFLTVSDNAQINAIEVLAV